MCLDWGWRLYCVCIRALGPDGERSHRSPGETLTGPYRPIPTQCPDVFKHGRAEAMPETLFTMRRRREMQKEAGAGIHVLGVF